MPELILKRRYFARIIMYIYLVLTTLLFFGLYYYGPSPWFFVWYPVALLPAIGYIFLPYNKPIQFIVKDDKLAVHYNYDEIIHRLSHLDWWAAGRVDANHYQMIDYNWVVIKFNDSKIKIYSYEYSNTRELVIFLFENYKVKWNAEAPAPVF